MSTTIETQVREWGGSLGIVIPKNCINEQSINAGDTIELVLLKKTNVINELFGKLKLKHSTEEILKEIDEEGWDA